MITVRPFRVRTVLDEKDWMVIAYHPYVASGKHIRRIHKMRRKKDRHEVIEASPPPRELRPFWVIDAQRKDRRAAVYALDVDDALRLSTLAGFRPDEERAVVGADHLWALAALSEDELLRQATYIWTDNSRGGMRHRIVPGAWHRTGWGRAGRAKSMTAAGRMGVALALRLAMTVPEMGALQTSGVFAPPGDAGPDQRLAARRRTLEIHAGNIPPALTAEMLSRFGAEISPWDPDSTELLAAFAEAYGCDPDEMRWPEIAALWKGGPEAMERARLDGELGMYDWFGYGIRHRISKRRAR